MRPEEIRAMVLQIAASQATKCIAIVDEQELTTGQLETQVEADNMTWEVLVTYKRDNELVMVQGRPIEIPVDGEQILAMIFGGGGNVEDHSFQYTVPASWVPEMEL